MCRLHLRLHPQPVMASLANRHAGRALADAVLVIQATVLFVALNASCSRVQAAEWGLQVKHLDQACVLQEGGVKFEI